MVLSSESSIKRLIIHSYRENKMFFFFLLSYFLQFSIKNRTTFLCRLWHFHNIVQQTKIYNIIITFKSNQARFIILSGGQTNATLDATFDPTSIQHVAFVWPPSRNICHNKHKNYIQIQLSMP